MQAIDKIVIVGGGTAGWMAAALLGKLMGQRTRIQLIESDQIGTVGVGEATIPPIKIFNDVLGLDENDFIRRTNGTFKLAIEFINWGKIGDGYQHTFGFIGKNLGMIPFYHYFLRAQGRGLQNDLWDFSLNYLAGQQKKFAPMAQIPNSPVSGINYAYHFDAGLYAAYLREQAEKWGVERTEGKIARVNQHSDTGFISDVVLENGTQIDGELFIDCSGFRGLLIEETLKTGYDDWTHWLPCDRALAVPSENVGDPRPYTQSIAHKAGWQWRIPLQHRTGNGHVYSSAHISDDEATSILLDTLEGAPIKDPIQLKFTTGVRRKLWNKNVVSLGLASGFIEPLESTSIHLIQHALVKLTKLFPSKTIEPSIVDEFNQQMRFDFEAIRDFIILHYHVNQRSEPFWQQLATMAIPDSLQQKIDLFRESGRIFRFNDELFADEAWLQVMLGQNITPAHYHPVADDISDQQLVEYLTNLSNIYQRGLAMLPPQSEYIKKHCAAAAV